MGANGPVIGAGAHESIAGRSGSRWAQPDGSSWKDEKRDVQSGDAVRGDSQGVRGWHTLPNLSNECAVRHALDLPVLTGGVAIGVTPQRPDDPFQTEHARKHELCQEEEHSHDNEQTRKSILGLGERRDLHEGHRDCATFTPA